MSLSLQEQLLTLTEPFRDSQILPREHKTDLEQRVKTFIDEMFANPEIAPADKNETLSLLHRCTPNTTITSLRGLLTLNLVNPLSPSAAKCTPYKEMQIPFITSYHSSPRYALTARLNPIDCESVIPQAVRNAIGRDLPIENVDLFLTTEMPPLMGYEDVSGEYFHKNYDQASTELLVKFHPWLYRDLPVGSNVTIKLSMGVFPGFGISKGQHDPISINSMSEKSVHAHPADDDATYMLYSPNNSHLAIDKDAPFCS
ncbi:MAG: hypothetical protein FJZ57_03375, partial [Chlamydiae bacterium]|nr:hypothetical protein [Chlamydiota bacterium]